MWSISHSAQAPFEPIHPYAAVFHPFLIFEFIDGCENRVGADPVGAVGVGQVSRHEYLVGFDLFEQMFHYVNIFFSQFPFFYCSCFIEWETEEMHMVGLHSDVVACNGCFGLAYHCLDFAHFGVSTSLLDFFAATNSFTPRLRRRYSSLSKPNIGAILSIIIK